MEGIDEQPQPCHFLRIPKEIRLEIYRLLMIPTKDPYLFATPDSAINFLDSDSEDDDFPFPITTRFIQDTDRIGKWRPASESGLECFESSKFHGAILRTNHQIYAEASSFLYSMAILMLEPGDILCLTKNPRSLKFGLPNKRVWRHNPLLGLGNTDSNGLVTYNSASMGGFLDPHVFARFRKVELSLKFGTEETSHVEMWMDDETLEVHPDHAEAFKTLVEASPLIKDFVKILSFVPQIAELSVRLEVQVMPMSARLMMDAIESDGSDSDDEKDERAEKLEEHARDRATELYMDSKALDPLLTLSNVKIFNFKIETERLFIQIPEYVTLPRHVKWIKEAKETIEGNFKSAAGSAA